MENFRAKQYENLKFEGGISFGGPCDCDYCIDEEIIDSLKKDRDRYFKLWLLMFIAWAITMTSLIIYILN